MAHISGITITGNGGVNVIGNVIGGGDVTVDGDEITVDGERLDGDQIGQVIITGRRTGRRKK